MNSLVPPDPFAFDFETQRLRMRPLEAEDEMLFCDLYTDAETMRFIGEPLSPVLAQRSFRKALASPSKFPPERLFLAIFEKTTRRPLGISAIVQFDAGMTRAEVGIMLKSDARFRGFAREGLGALVETTFSVFPASEIWVECSARNPLVERMVSSIGFRRCDDSEKDEGPLSKRIWSVDRSSWCATNRVNNRGED